jgi:hypothetical protein
MQRSPCDAASRSSKIALRLVLLLLLIALLLLLLLLLARVSFR